MNRIAIVLLVLGLVVGSAVGYVFHRPVAPSSSAATVAPNKARTELRVLYWYDPMQPSQHFDKPGKSPYMDMDLLPKYADDAGDAAAGVRIDSATAQNLGIRTAIAERGVLVRSVHAVGNVGYDDNDIAVVQARTAGFVSHLYVRAPLTKVHRGEPLADLVAPEWTAAEQEYLALQHSTSADAELRAAARDRLRVLGIPDSNIAALDRSGKAPANTTLSAPIDGVISELAARDGMAVVPGTPLFRVSGLARVWITAEVAEVQAAAVHAGGSATVHVPAWPGRDFSGRVIAVLPSVSTNTRTIAVRIGVPNADLALAPGMYADVEFAPPSADPAVLVPTEAILHTGTRTMIIVADGNAYRAAEVHTGAESNGKMEVLDGLAAGDRVVISGQFLIDSEASLRATLTRLSAPSAERTP